MNSGERTEKFYIDDHAALYGLIARSADEVCGENGLRAIVRGIETYGRERGLRGAIRCVADGCELSMKNYILYGEWSDPRGWSKTEVVSTSPGYKTRVTSCAWCDAWTEYGLIEYGKVYCEWIDRNLVHGFNPALELGVGGAISHGNGACEFDWIGCSLETEEDISDMARRRAELAPRVTRDFLYHCGHVLHTFRRELSLELGLIKGGRIIAGALDEYADNFGRLKAEAVVREAAQDFLELD